MVDLITTVSVLELLIGAVAATVAYVAWGYRNRPGGFPLFVVTVGTAGMAVTNGLHSLVDDPMFSLLIRHAVFPFAAITAVGWFFIGVEYTDRLQLQRPTIRRLAIGFVLLDLLVVVTNPVHHLFTTQASTVSAQGVFEPVYGPLFWLHSVISFGLVFLGLAFLLVEFLQVRGIYRKQSGTVSAAGVVGVGFVLFQVLGPDLVPGFAIGTVGLTIMCVMLLWAIFRADFLETVPVARKALMESMDDAVVALNTAGRVIDLNPQAKRLLDVDDGAVGRPAKSVFGDYPDLVSQFQTTYNTQTEIAVEDDAEARHYDLNISPVFDRTAAGRADPPARDALVGRIIVIHDITERKQREEELERQNKRLNEFASIVSHDLRNPLNVAHGNLSLAREECDSERLGTVERALDRIEVLIDDLLALAREGESVSDVEAVDLAALAGTSWQNVDTAKATLAIATNRVILADKSRTQQLLENLIRNAVEHGGDDVSVTVGASDSGFYVEDDGPGIPDDEREAVFEPGYSTADEGTGFGLSIVRQIVEAHDWDISVTNGAEGGTRFEITGVRTDEKQSRSVHRDPTKSI